MNKEQTSKKKNGWIWIIPAAIAVMVISVAILILYMMAYGRLINPGQTAAHYLAHAKASAPYSTVFVGMPLMFLACLWIGRKFADQLVITAALLVWLVYCLIDMTLLMLGGELSRLPFFFVISYLTKLPAAYLGGLAARKRLVAASV